MEHNRLVNVARFLKPTKLKLLFLVEWGVFILLQITRGEITNLDQLLIAGTPFLFFYLLACGFTQLSFSRSRIVNGWKIIPTGFILATLDQSVKLFITYLIPYQASQPIIHGWLHLSHEHNLHGSWFVATFNPIPLSPISLFIIVIPLLLGTILFHRYYLHTQRESTWADLAFLGLFAGLLSWVFDMGLRGYIVDYIQLPDIMIADFKDILLTIGIASLFVEVLDQPRISFQWKGVRKEIHDFAHACSNIIQFSFNEMSEMIDDLVRLTKSTKR
jgi:lipoprotein signal peptidase